MPESGKLTLKAQLASEVAHIRRARPEIGIVAIADGAADNWTFLETLSPETHRLLACEQTASDHAVSGSVPRVSVTIPCGVAKVIRALRQMPPLRRIGPSDGNSPSSASIAIACATTP